jgi:hypothetical protein
MVACDKKKTARVCFWSVKYHTRAFLGLGKALDRSFLIIHIMLNNLSNNLLHYPAKAFIFW